MKDIYRLFSIWWSNNNVNSYKIPDIKELTRAMKLKYNVDDYTLYKGFKVHIIVDDQERQQLIDDLV